MAKPTQSSAVNIQTTVALNPTALEYAKRNAKDGDVAAALASWCSYFVDLQSRGGVMISPEDHDYLSTLNDGKRFTSSRQLASMVAKGLRRDDGQFASVAKIDPALIVPLQDQAQQMGWTVEELITNGLNQMLTNSWLASLEPENKLMFTDEAMSRLRQIVGMNSFTGEELVAALEKQVVEQTAA